MIAPLRPCRMADEVPFARFTGDVSYWRQRWEVLGPVAGTAADESGDLYRGFPVLRTAPNWTEDLSIALRRARDIVDSMTGIAAADDQAAGPVPAQSHRWLLDGRAQIAAFRAWLYARRGRLSAFWLPSFAQDLDLAAAALTTDAQITVVDCGYTAHQRGQIGRRDVRIALKSGVEILRRIVAADVAPGGLEVLRLDSTLGQAFTPGDVAAISFVHLARLDADAVEISWSGPDLAQCALVTQGPRNDV